MVAIMWATSSRRMCRFFDTCDWLSSCVVHSLRSSRHLSHVSWNPMLLRVPKSTRSGIVNLGRFPNTESWVWRNCRAVAALQATKAGVWPRRIERRGVLCFLVRAASFRWTPGPDINGMFPMTGHARGPGGRRGTGRLWPNKADTICVAHMAMQVLANPRSTMDASWKLV